MSLEDGLVTSPALLLPRHHLCIFYGCVVIHGVAVLSFFLNLPIILYVSVFPVCLFRGSRGHDTPGAVNMINA